MKANILFIGFEIGSNRSEAVCINYLNHVNNILPHNIKHTQYALSSSVNFLRHIQKIFHYFNDVNNIITDQNITHVHDLFVLPLLSFLFALSIKIKNPKVVLIKELHNNYGSSKKMSFESILRLLFSNKISVMLVLKIFDKVYSRNKYISKLLKIKYIPQYVKIFKEKKLANFNQKIIRVCYLGHALSKKGVDIFPLLINSLDDSIVNKIVFNFAFSDIGKPNVLIKNIKHTSVLKGVKVNFLGKVNPAEFFRKNNLFILPLQDEHSATSTPNTLLESMEAGCVVAATKNPIVGSVIKNGENGVLISDNPAKSINYLIKDIIKSPKKFVIMGKKAHKYIEHNFNVEYIKRSFEKIYNI